MGAWGDVEELESHTRGGIWGGYNIEWEEGEDMGA